MRLRHRVTGVTVSVADDKKMAPEWKPVGVTAPAGPAPAGEPLAAPKTKPATVAELRAEIERRNEGRDEADLLPIDGKKADLLAVIEADDETSEG